MSHFTTLQTQISHGPYLITALQNLGYRPEEGRVYVKGYGGSRTPVDIRIPSKAFGYDVGFRKEGSHYVCVADWFGVRGIQQETFLQTLTQQYASIAVKDQLASQGFALAEEKQVEGRIHLVLRRMA
jgi:hypothetical protein